MAAKLGWRQWLPGDETLVDDWWGRLHTQRADFTLSFRRLAQFEQDSEPFLSLFEDRGAAQAWLDKYRLRLATQPTDPAERVERMNRVNPVYVLRNHLADRKSVVEGKSVSVRVDLGGRRIIKKKNKKKY